jgi:hypothetical protein
MLNVKSWRVLVVEDEFDSIQMVSKILRHHGAEDAHEAGFDGYFPKPLDTARIVESLAELLKD